MNSQKKSKTRIFLRELRQSQMYVNFIQDRLKRLAENKLSKTDPFEYKIELIEKQLNSINSGEHPKADALKNLLRAKMGKVVDEEGLLDEDSMGKLVFY